MPLSPPSRQRGASHPSPTSYGHDFEYSSSKQATMALLTDDPPSRPSKPVLLKDILAWKN